MRLSKQVLKQKCKKNVLVKRDKRLHLGLLHLSKKLHFFPKQPNQQKFCSILMVKAVTYLSKWALGYPSFFKVIYLLTFPRVQIIQYITVIFHTEYHLSKEIIVIFLIFCPLLTSVTLFQETSATYLDYLDSKMKLFEKSSGMTIIKTFFFVTEL